MGRINVLDKHVAELIAAGEVVERPSSVIKELVENSIDSGATAITVEIQNGGITFMRVHDNGSGIMRDDIRNAFLRHATSKVKEQNDLDSIGTLGFRGEALASIAAVAKVDLLTKAAEDTEGTHYVIHGCDEVSFEDAGCPQGTTFVVRDLFYNVPARMKFLKKNTSEANAVAAVIDRIALSHSEIAFTFIRDNKKALVTSGDGNLRNCIYAVYGREFTQGIIPVDYELDGVRVNGYITKPQASRASRAMQTFFINGRYVKSRTAVAALEEACKGTVMVGKFPACVLNIDLSLNAVDVNVHPAKIEVRFVNERPIFDAVYHGVKSALIKGDTTKQFKLDMDNLIDKSVVQKPYTMSQYTVEKIKNSPDVRSIEKVSKTAVRNYGTLLENTKNDTFSVSASKRLCVHEEESTTLSDFAAENGEKHRFGVVPISNDTPSGSASCDTEPIILQNKDDSFLNASSNRIGSYVNIDIAVDDDEFENVSPTGASSSAERIVPEEPAKPSDAAEQIVTVEQASDSCPSEPAKEEQKNTHGAESVGIDTDIIVDEKENDTISTIIPTDDDNIKYIGEAFATYIIVERNNEILLIDKHAAHERMIYEKLKRDQGKRYKQYLLEPVAVTLSKQQYGCILENRDLIAESGFDTDDFGQGTILVRCAPSFIDASDISATIEEMADHILESKRDISTEYMDWLYHNIACRSAIKGGDLNSPEELMLIVKHLDDDVNYKYCPHGRPTSIVITKRQLEKQFGRV